MIFLVQLITSIFILGQASLSDSITSHIERCELNSASLVDIHACLKAEYKLKVIEGDYVTASQLLKILSTEVQIRFKRLYTVCRAVDCTRPQDGTASISRGLGVTFNAISA